MTAASKGFLDSVFREADPRSAWIDRDKELLISARESDMENYRMLIRHVDLIYTFSFEFGIQLV